MNAYPAAELIRDRYVPYRAEHGKRLPFESADYRAVLSPFDRRPIAQVGFMNERQAQENLDTLSRLHLSGAIPKTHERIQILKRAAKRLSERSAAFADLIAWEGGKPLKDALIEVARAVSSIEWAAEEVGRIAGSEVPMRATKAACGHLAFTYPEPLGPVLAISAFNHPLNLIAHQVAPAIAAGCPVLVKPAIETPLSCLHLLELFYEAGLPPEMALALVCDNDVAEEIARSPKIAFMSFIGSAKVGWHLRNVLQPGVRFALEHGGSAPAIVDRSADLAAAIPTLVKGAYYHSGQVCVSTQRIFVHEEILERFETEFIQAVRALKVGDPRDGATDCGPLIRERDLERVVSWINEAVKDGARVLTGGRRVGETLLEPTLIRGARPDAKVMREEVFGPVACLMPFTELHEAIAGANDVPWMFQAAVFTNDFARASEAIRGLRASAVMVNESTAFRVDWMPFRGDGPSGFGTGGIGFTLRDLMKEKLVVMKSPHFEL